MRLRPLFRALVPLALALVVAVAVSAAAVTPLQAHAQDVRSAVPAAEAYYADNGTYAGMTVAKLRRIDTGIKRVLVRDTTKNGYCIQSTLAPFVHFTGPGGLTRAGACGVKGTAIPYVSAPVAATPVESSIASVRSAIPAIEAYYSDHGHYTGMTIAKLRAIDQSIAGIVVRSAASQVYCIQSVRKPVVHYVGPGGPTRTGACGVNGAPVS